MDHILKSGHVKRLLRRSNYWKLLPPAYQVGQVDPSTREQLEGHYLRKSDVLEVYSTHTIIQPQTRILTNWYLGPPLHLFRRKKN